MKKIKILSVCSGVGGLDHPFYTDPNFEIIGFSETDKHASAVLKYHYPGIINYGDITRIKTDELPDFDLLTFGFPCQPYSLAGKRGGLEDPKGKLIYSILNILKYKKPKFFIAENVKGLLSQNKGVSFKLIINQFINLGYWPVVEVLNAKEFGVPQNRERLFILGINLTEIQGWASDIKDGQKKKLDLLKKIIKSYLLPIFLKNLKEAQNLLGQKSKERVLFYVILAEISQSLGRMSKIELFQKILINQLKKSQNYFLIKHFLPFISSVENLEEEKNNKKDTTTIKKALSTYIFQETTGDLSIEELLRTILEESFAALKKYTILTATKEIIPLEIYTYLKVNLHMLKAMDQLTKSSGVSWKEILSSLIEKQENMSYAEFSNSKFFTVGGRKFHSRDISREFNKSRNKSNTNKTSVRGTSRSEILSGSKKIEMDYKIEQDDQQREKRFIATRYLGRNGGLTSDLCPTIQSSDHPHIKLLAWSSSGRDWGRDERITLDQAHTLNTGDGCRTQSAANYVTHDEETIRKLTPLECERFMSWEDLWTKYGDYEGVIKEISDNQRYKMIGNGVVSACVYPIKKVILEMEKCDDF